MHRVPLPLTVRSVVLLLLTAALPASAQTLPRTLGWYEFPDTAFQRVCPPNGFGNSEYAFADNCRYVTEAWNSAVMDTRRNRLIVWGGGHADYYGNELYALDVNSLKIQRLTDPGLPVSQAGCPESIAKDTQANTRHTYDAIAYMENVDRMWVFGGSLTPCGFFGRGTWTFDFGTLTWERRHPSGDIPSAVPGIVSAYDPKTGKVFLHDNLYLYAYDFTRDRYERLMGPAPIDYHTTGVLDPVRRKFIVVGGGSVHVYDVGRTSLFGGRRTPKTTGGDAIVNSDYPGLAYDPVTDRIVAWNGGDSVYSLNLETNTWTAVTYPNGPGNAHVNGTYKRWSYSPTSGIFVLVNGMGRNAYGFRLTLPTGSIPEPTAPSVPAR